MVTHPIKFISWLFGLFIIVATAQAQSLSPQQFEDQFAEPISLDHNTKWLIFSHDKDGGDWVKQSLEGTGLSDLASKNAIYVSDISKMPSIITKMFALPKMKKYAFKMALDKTGEATANWPKQASTVTLMQLNNLSVVEVIHANRTEQIEAFIKRFE